MFDLSNRSAPEFNSSVGDSALRKTQSHPINRVHHLSPSKSTFKTVGSPKLKSDRCKSIPGQFPQSLVEGGGTDGGGGDYANDKASCPNSPLDTSRDFLRNLVADGSLRKFSAPAVEPNSGSSSPKPKKTIFDGFRNTLGRKSKSNDSSKSQTDSLPQSPTTSVEAANLFALDGGNNLEAGMATVETTGEATSAASAATPANVVAATTTSLSPSTTSSRVSGRNVSW